MLQVIYILSSDSLPRGVKKNESVGIYPVVIPHLEAFACPSKSDGNPEAHAKYEYIQKWYMCAFGASRSRAKPLHTEIHIHAAFTVAKSLT